MADTLKVHFVKSTAEDGIVDLVPTGVTSTKTILSMVICGKVLANGNNCTNSSMVKCSLSINFSYVWSEFSTIFLARRSAFVQ